MNRLLMGLPSPSWFPPKRNPEEAPSPPSGPLLYVGRDVRHYTFPGWSAVHRLSMPSAPSSAKYFLMRRAKGASGWGTRYFWNAVFAPRCPSRSHSPRGGLCEIQSCVLIRPKTDAPENDIFYDEIQMVSRRGVC